MFTYRETIGVSLFFIGVALLTAWDLYEDWHEKLPLEHLLAESSIMVVSLTVTALIVLRLIRARNMQIHQLRESVKDADLQSQHYKQLTEELRSGLTESIINQLHKWQLTSAEQDVCHLLLKGLSLQEIADIRGSSERTIRQQASVIYKKSGMHGRAELSAYFMEDLLSPITNG